MDTIGALRAIVGESGVVDAADIAKRSAGFMRPDMLQARVLVRPKDTKEASKAVRWCHDNGLRVVTQGGLTGLVHGADASPEEVILSMERMRTIEAIDPVQRIAVVQAGVTLQALQATAEQHELSFPLDLGARGTATVGGNASTNAGVAAEDRGTGIWPHRPARGIDFGRTRNRIGEEALSLGLPKRKRNCADARSQEGARSRRDPKSRQDHLRHGSRQDRS